MHRTYLAAHCTRLRWYSSPRPYTFVRACVSSTRIQLIAPYLIKTWIILLLLFCRLQLGAAVLASVDYLEGFERREFAFWYPLNGSFVQKFTFNFFSIHFDVNTTHDDPLSCCHWHGSVNTRVILIIVSLLKIKYNTNSCNTRSWLFHSNFSVLHIIQLFTRSFIKWKA